MYTLFTHSANFVYKSPIFSKATVFYILTTLLTFIPPLLIVYRSQGKAKEDDVEKTYGLLILIHFLTI